MLPGRAADAFMRGIDVLKLSRPGIPDYRELNARLVAATGWQIGALDHLARLYWYTVEFGLIQQPDGLRIYGAGILSSYAESIFALDDASPNRIAFDLLRVMRTRYRIDDFQQSYFVISSIDQLLNVTVENDFAPLYAQLETLPDIRADEIMAEDVLRTHGTQAYAKGAGR